MVPFWRRRLLAVTLPVVWISAGICFGLISFGIDTLRQRVAMRDTSFLDPAWPYMVAAWAMLAPFVLASLVPIGTPAPKSKQLPGYWISRTACTLRVSVALYLILNAVIALDLPSIGLFFDALLGLAIIPISLSLAIGVSIGCGRVLPRERSLGVAEGRHAHVFAAMLALLLPSIGMLWQSTRHDYRYLDHDYRFMVMAIMLNLVLLALASSLIGRWFFGQLLIRHAPYHARHCHRCGYDLLGAERTNCPECDHPISSDQLRSLAQLDSNGPHATSSSPTSSM